MSSSLSVFGQPIPSTQATDAELSAAVAAAVAAHLATMDHANLLRPYNVIAETVAVHTLLNAAIVSTGVPMVVAIALPAGQAINTVSWFSGSQALVAGSNADAHLWSGIVDSSLVVKAISADDTAPVWAANAKKDFTMSAAYTPLTTALHYLVLMCARGTGGSPAAPSVYVAQNPSAIGGRALTAASNRSRAFNNNESGVTTPPALAATIGAFGANHGSIPYATVS